MTKELNFNGKRFAHLSSGKLRDCLGYFKELTAGNMALYTSEGKLEAAIINNSRQGRFVVSAGTDSKGKDFFMHSTSSLTEKWLGIEDMKMAELSEVICNMKVTSAPPGARIGEPGFDPAHQESLWGSLPVSMKLMEYHGDGDPAFGGAADDRVVLTTGKVAERGLSVSDRPAMFSTVAEAHRFAQAIPNRRPGSILGLVPKWR